MRRKLFIYCIGLISGISIAYLFEECGKLFLPLILICSIYLILKKVVLDLKERDEIREKKIIAFMMIAGFCLFSLNYMNFNSAVKDLDGNKLEICNIGSIECKVLEIKEAKDSTKLIVKPINIKSADKVQISCYQEIGEVNDIYDLLGAHLTVYGNLKEPAGQDNPGCFNYALYQKSKGIRFNMTSKAIRIDSLSDGLYWKYKRNIFETRERFLDSFEDEEVRAFIKGIIFGDKSDIDEETIEEFNENSTGHILAVSGLHIGFLFALIRLLTRKSRNKLLTTVIIIVLILYGEMTAWSPSTMRAVLVLSINLISIYIEKKPDLLSSISAAAMIILIFNPYMLFNSGFQMSFIALLGLIFLCPFLENMLGAYIGSMFAIQISIVPIVAYNFSRFNPISMFINIPVVFLASILVPVCILSLPLMLAFNFLPGIDISLIELLSRLILKINALFNFDGIFSLDISIANQGLLLAFYIVIFLASSEWFRIKLLRGQKNLAIKTVVVLIIPVLIASFAFHNKYLNDEIVFVSVGQGDCTHIRASGNVLIDGGGSRDYNVGKNTLKPYLLKNKVRAIDAAAVTHLHMDHFQGIMDLNSIYPIKSIVIPNTYSSALESEISRLSNINYIGSGNKISLSNDCYIEPIWPTGQYVKNIDSEDKNENNMVYMIYCKNKKIMVTGDLAQADELNMIKYYKGTDKLDCDILKVGHHGSKTSTSEEFLDALTPQIAVISVGANNMYGHPNQETLDKLNAHGITTYRTDLNGAVGIDIHKTGIKVDTMR